MKIDHIGVVVESLEGSIESYCDKFGYDSVSPIFQDNIQKVRVTFLSSSEPSERIELIEPLDESSPVYKFLKSQGGVHHIAYKVNDIKAAVDEAESKGATVICPPVPGAGHDNALVAFIYYNSDCPRGHISEFVECK